jgi:hypothetical protein
MAIANARLGAAFLLLLVTACSSGCSNEERLSGDARRDIAIVVPTQLPEQEAIPVAGAIHSGLINSAAANVGLSFVDGALGERFATAELVNDARVRANAPLRRELTTPFMDQFVARYRERNGEAPLDLVAAADGMNRLAGSVTSTAVVIYAPLQRRVDTDVGVAIRDGLYPSLGFLFAPADASTLSVQGREHRLQGLDVYLVSPASETWTGESGQRYQRAVTRVWYWWATLQGATVRYIGPSLETAVRLAVDNEGRPSEDYAPEPDPSEKAEMLTVNLAPACIDPERTVTSSAAPSRTTGPLIVGITWQGGDTDLDLHARAHADAPELFFQQTTAAGAQFEKRPAAIGETGARGFEWVRFDNVNVRQVRLAVNLYEVIGREALAQGPRGQLRVAFDGRCYVHDFHLRARRGNAGAGRDDPNRGAREEWIEFELAGILGLN